MPKKMKKSYARCLKNAPPPNRPQNSYFFASSLTLLTIRYKTYHPKLRSKRILPYLFDYMGCFSKKSPTLTPICRKNGYKSQPQIAKMRYAITFLRTCDSAVD